MRSASRFLAAAFAVVVWLLAGLSVASGTLLPRAITPASFGATASAWLPDAD
jgi:hypothetical protein